MQEKQKINNPPKAYPGHQIISRKTLIMATVLTTKKKTTATVIVVGASSAALPDNVADAINNEAARLAKKKNGGTSSLLADGHRYVLTAPKAADHLIGGEQWRLAAAAAVRALRDADISSATLLLDGDNAVIQAFVEGVALADYRFMECKKDDKRAELTLHLSGASAATKKAIAAGLAVASGQNFARTLADCPPNILYPATFIDRVRKAVRGTGLKIKAVQGLNDLSKNNFPGLVTVGKGSRNEPAMLQISYTPMSKKQQQKRDKN